MLTWVNHVGGSKVASDVSMIRARGIYTLLVGAVWLGACTVSPHVNGTSDPSDPIGDGDGDGDGDGAPDPTPDPDPSWVDVELRQVSSQIGSSFGCSDENNINFAHSFYRVFDLESADYALGSDVKILTVEFAVRYAEDQSGSDQDIEIKLHTLDRAAYGDGSSGLDLDELNQVVKEAVKINDTDHGVLYDVDLVWEAPATGLIVAEIAIPDGRKDQAGMWLGTSSDMESKPSYFHCPPEPVEVLTSKPEADGGVILSLKGQTFR